MCCGRRHRRTPIVVVLGKMAYDKYQDRKARKLSETESVSDSRERFASPERLQLEANNEILEKAGISPPSYNEVVVNRAEVPSNYIEGVVKDVKSDLAVSREDRIFQHVANGMSFSEAGLAEAHGPLCSNCSGSVMVPPVQPVYRSKCEQKKAERAARKAQRKAMGGCC